MLLLRYPSIIEKVVEVMEVMEVMEGLVYVYSAQYMAGPGLLCTVRNCSVDSLAAAVRVKVGDILQ